MSGTFYTWSKPHLFHHYYDKTTLTSPRTVDEQRGWHAPPAARAYNPLASSRSDRWSAGSVERAPAFHDPDHGYPSPRNAHTSSVPSGIGTVAMPP